MTIYSLYVKTHNKTGLKYLGYTSKSDPHKYPGSGYYWKDHCKIHGFDYSTKIIRECKDKEEIKKWGIYYSKLWNVVHSKSEDGKKLWANLKEESGDGNTSDDARSFWSMERRKSQSERNRETNKNLWNRSDYREKMTNMASDWSKALWNNQEFRAMQSRLSKERVCGKKHPLYDSTIYHFLHENGTEEFCTRYELYTKYSLPKDSITRLVKNIYRTCKGWKVVNNKNGA